MDQVTFSFLIVDHDIQDTVSYKVQPEYNFEQVIVHITSAFHLDRSTVMIKSSLGFEVKDTTLSTKEIYEKYGSYFKLIVDQSKTDQMSKEADVIQNDGIGSHKQGKSTTDKGKFEKTTDQDQLNESHLFDEMLDNLTMIRSENYEIDERGYTDIVIIPRIDTYVTHLEVKYHVDRTLEELFRDITSTLNTNIENILISPREHNTIIANLEIPIRQAINDFGPSFIIHDISTRDDIEDPSNVSQQLRDLIFKYKK